MTLAPELIYTIEIRNPEGELVAILEHAHNISYSRLLNSPHVLEFSMPATDDKASHIILANEFWLRDNRTGEVVRKFKLQRQTDVRQ